MSSITADAVPAASAPFERHAARAAAEGPPVGTNRSSYANPAEYGDPVAVPRNVGRMLVPMIES